MQLLQATLRKPAKKGMSEPRPTCSSFLSIFLLLLLISATSAAAAGKKTMGINYGRVANNLPEPREAISLIRQMHFGKVKIYDTDAKVLHALANTSLEAVVMMRNQQVVAVGSNQNTSDKWVKKNILPWLPAVNIKTVSVGNEIDLIDPSLRNLTWPKLVPAMENLHLSLKRHQLSQHIKVTTAVSMGCLETSYPPSSGTFRQEIATSIMAPMLHFLNKTGSAFFIDVYPFFAYASDPKDISLDYALFGSNNTVVRDGGLNYTNLLEAQIDALLAAMGRLGYENVKLVISETGWPTQGDASEAGANITNAALYNNRLIKWALADTNGTPRRPGVAIPTFIFALFNENLKPGPTSERNWGLLYPNASHVYPIDIP